MKRVVLFFLIVCLSILLTACGKYQDENNTKSNEKDDIAPIFTNLIDGDLPPIKHLKGEEVNLLENVSAIDNKLEVTLSIFDLGTYNKDVPGVYTIVIQAEDNNGNKTKVTREVTVYNLQTITYDALTIDDNAIKYEFNNTNAFKYTQSGAAFKLNDAVHVMTKEFFIEEYNEHKDEHINNGKVPYLSNGVVLVIDKNMKVKLLRISAGINLELDENGNIKSSKLSWSNSLDIEKGGGNFAGLIDEIDKIIPDGGYIIFTSNKDEANGKKFLIKNLFFANYQGGSISINDQNIDLLNIQIEFVDDYQEEIEVIEDYPLGTIVKEELVYEAIPFSVYYKNDYQEKPILFFFHGFTSDHDSGIMNRGRDLAEMGFMVVAMDAYLHGDRETEYFAGLSYGEKQKEIVNIQVKTAKEAQFLFHKYFKKWENIKQNKVYAYGVSMGAGIAFYLATIMDELQTVVSIVGSPSFYEFYQYKRDLYNWEKDDYYYLNLEYYKSIDPLLNFEKLKDKKIFMGNGSKDTTVPYSYAQKLYNLLDSDNVFFNIYDTGHSSTAEMQQDSYDFLKIS